MHCSGHWPGASGGRQLPTLSHETDTLCPREWTVFWRAPDKRVAGKIRPMKLSLSAVWLCVALGACGDPSQMSEAQVKEVRTQVEGALVNAYDLSKPGLEQR